MRLHCPNCQAILNIQDDTLDQETACPSCGSRVALSEKTMTYRQPHGGKVAHFALLEELGRGQFGTVWRARDEKLGRIVAIKIPRREELDARTRQMFQREAKAAASLNHPNVVQVFETFEQDGLICIVSEFIKGITLKECLQRRRCTYREAAELTVTIAHAIDYAHEEGVIHRDLKPGNILIDENQQPHVADFGLAKQEAAEITVTMTGDLLGTPAYMSPEQAGGGGHRVDRRSDVFSLGVILYEMLTGRRPFQGLSTALLKQIQTADPRAPRTIEKHLPRDLETICLKALAKEKERRYATAKELAQDLERFLAGVSIKARRTSIVERGVRWVRKNAALSAVTLLALSSSAAALALVQHQPRETIVPAIPAGAKVETLLPLKVAVNSKPAGANLACFPRDRVTGEIQLTQSIHANDKTPCSIELLPGDYLFVVTLEDGRFHEVYRHVPKDPRFAFEAYTHRMWDWSADAPDRISVPTIKIPALEITNGMVALEGSPDFQVGLPGNDQILAHTRVVAPFYLDPEEVTIADFRKGFGGTFPGNLQPPKSSDPATFPMTGTLFDYCVQYAEMIGKRLPTEFEYEFAATNGGVTRFPWGNDDRTLTFELLPIHQPFYDRTMTESPIFGLCSNAAEYTDSPYAPYPKSTAAASISAPIPFANVTIRGGGFMGLADELNSLQQMGVRSRAMLPRKPFELALTNRIGFRCARSQNPRW